MQAFQRKIYLKAKQNPNYKFYCLYDKVHRKDAIKEAYKRVKANKGAPGIDQQTFLDLEQEGKEESFLEEIQQELIQQTYTPQKLREIKIPKGKNKTRTLRIPTIKDRVVQMAIKIIIEPIFESEFKENSYGYRPKKSAHQAITRLDKALFPDIYKPQHQQKEICSIDLSNCFDTIPHHELIHLVAKRIIDRKLLMLIKAIIKSGAMQPEEKNEEGRGTPQGGVLSPLLANIYLDQLDEFWETRKTKSFMFRYADDMVILLHKKDEETYQAFLKSIENEFKLTVNKEKTIRTTRREGFDFLGFTIKQKTSRNKKQYLAVEPSKKSLKRIREKIKNITKRRTPISNEQVIEGINSILRGWHHYFDNISMGKTREQVKWYTENRLVKFLFKRKKKKGSIRNIYKNKKLYTEYELYELKSMGRKFT